MNLDEYLEKIRLDLEKIISEYKSYLLSEHPNRELSISEIHFYFDDRLKKLFDEETEKLKPKQPMSENKIDWEFLTALGDKGLTTRIRRVMEMCGLIRDNNDALMFYNNYPLQWRTFGEKANKTLENYLLKKGLIKKEK